MSWTLCTSGGAVTRAGVNANSAIILSGGSLANYSDWIESGICAETFYDWITNYSSISAIGKNILANAATAGIARDIIAYDTSGYTKLLEAQTMMDLHDATYKKMIDRLNDVNTRKKILGVSG